MNIWALADLHLALSMPEKDMAFFGPVWEGYVEKIEKHWRDIIKDEDIVLIAGDISWAMKLDKAEKDLAWIDSLPGKKVLLKGNHDYWWPSNAKLEKALPPSISFVHNNAFSLGELAVAGTKLWDHPAINYNAYVTFQDNPRQKAKEPPSEASVIAAFDKELVRFERSLQAMPIKAKLKIAMTHYPPIDEKGQFDKVHALLKQYGVTICIFGHLHNIRQDEFPKLCFDNLPYYLTAADFLNFKPLKLATL